MKNGNNGKKILILGDSIESANANCVLSIANSFEEKRYDVSVILKGESEKETQINQCKVFIIKDHFYLRLSAKINRLPISALIKKSLLKILRLFVAGSNLMHVFSWPYYSFTHTLYCWLKIKTLYKLIRPDIVISTFHPIEALYSGKRLQSLGNHFHFLVFLDGLYAGTKPKAMTNNQKNYRSIQLEEDIIQNSDLAIMMESAKSLYCKNKEKIPYINKIKFLDIPLFLPIKSESNIRKWFPRNQKVLLFCGSFPKGVRDPRYFLSLVDEVIEATELEVYFIGTSDYLELENTAKANQHIHYLGQLSHNLAMEYVLESDFLLNIGNTISSMVPSKVFEYISTGKPIISLYSNNDDSSIKYLIKYSNALLINTNDTKDVNIKKITKFVTEGKHSALAAEKLLGEFVNNTPDAYVECIETFIMEHPIRNEAS